MKSYNFAHNKTKRAKQKDTMIPFHKITEADIDTIVRHYPENERENAHEAIANHLSVNASTSWAIVEGQLVLRQEAPAMYIYTCPCGDGMKRLALMQMMEDANVMGYDWIIVGIPYACQKAIASALPGHFHFVHESKYSFLELLTLTKSISDEPAVVAVPTMGYSESLFCNNEGMVPTIGEFGQCS